jgi:hypothetical protein
MDRLVTDTARLALGTAQWGLAYGIANRTGRPALDEIAAMAAMARTAGIGTLDTARAYGDSERAIGFLGPGWRVVTKLAPDVAGDDIGADDAAERARASLAASRAALGRDHLDAVLLHRSAHRQESDGAAWKVLREERAAGRIDAIGASVTRVDEAAALLADADVEIVQVPASLLDRRLARTGFFDEAARLGREIFVRSVFLQGAALLEPRTLPPHLSPLGPALDAISDTAEATGIDRAALLLAWARHRLNAARVLIGCETREQLTANLAAWSRPGLADIVRSLEDRVPELPDAVLDPWRWPSP